MDDVAAGAAELISKQIAGYSLADLIYAMQSQLAALEKDSPPSSANRYLSVARTNVEISYFYLERYERETATRVPLIPLQ